MEQRANERPEAAVLSDAFSILLRVNLLEDRCTVIKSDLADFQPDKTAFQERMEEYARRAACPSERDRLLAFVNPQHLRAPLPAGQSSHSMLFRRQDTSSCRWNLIEFLPDPGGKSGLFCVKDIHDPLTQSAIPLKSDQPTQAEMQEAERLRDLKDRAYIISSISTLFFSTYYVDLEHDTFRAVTQLRPVGDLLGDVVNFPSGLQIYANHFVHPDDRAEYLRVMDPENLRRELRWWHPCVAVEYRRLPGPGSEAETVWVRATAVMAQSREDGELPKTAVYVAQEIAGGRRRPEAAN